MIPRSILPPTRAAILAVIVGSFAVGREPAGADDSKVDERDFPSPESCAPCHPRHYLEWRGSAHAYSAADPLVVACGRRALKDTDGKIGDFCVRCHAPVGARSGELASTFDLAVASPAARQGVTCVICHRMEPPSKGQPIANASFELRTGNVFHAGLQDPIATTAHETASSEFIGTSAFCGSCHDVLHAGALIEKAYAQWSGSVHEERGNPCQECHMLLYSGEAAVGGPFREKLHRHGFPAVSVALLPFPNKGYQREQIQEFLGTAARMSVRVPPAARAGGILEANVTVKNSGAGHNLPTGLSNERQLWIEVTVLDEAGKTLFRSGDLDSNGDLKDRHSALEPGADPHLTLFSDRFVDEKGAEAPFVFLAAGVEVGSLKPLESRTAVYKAPIAAWLEGSRVRVRVRLLFRSFPPYALRDLGISELAKDVPIWELAKHDSGPIPVLKELPRRAEHRVPGDFSSIQDAIDFAQDGDRVLVAAGEHEVRRPIDFRGKRIQVLGPGGRDVTRLRWAGDRSAGTGSVVVFQGGEGPDSRLEGFTISGGVGSLLPGRSARAGGGVLVSRSSPTIASCRVEGCAAEGGIGGGIASLGGAPRITDSEVLACSADTGGGMAWHADSQVSVTLESCAIQGCRAARGGGIALASAASLSLRWSELAGNRAADDGAAIWAAGGQAIALDHCTIVHNNSEKGTSVIAGFTSRPVVSNSILWSNTPPVGDANLSYCILDQEPLPATCLKAFPLFVDPTGFWETSPERWVRGDYRLLHGSPAIDAGDPAWPADPDDSRTDIGAHFYEQPLRAFVRGDVDGDRSVGLRDIVLLVEHLFGAKAIPCDDAADVDDSGRIDPADVAALANDLRTRPCALDPTFGEGLGCFEGCPPPGK